MNLLTNRNRLTDVANRLAVARGGGRLGVGWTRVWGQQMQTSTHRMDTQGLTVQHRELVNTLQ